MINLILGYILPFVLLVLAFYLIKTFRDEKIIKWVGIAVRAAEQMFKESGQGEEKFEYVFEWISKKFKISKADLKNLIESAVYEINGEKNAK